MHIIIRESDSLPIGELVVYHICRPWLMDGYKFCVIMQDTCSLLTGGFEKLLRIFDLNRPEAPRRLL